MRVHTADGHHRQGCCFHNRPKAVKADDGAALHAIARGAPLAEAIDAGGEGFDPTALLTALVTGHAITAIHEATP